MNNQMREIIFRGKRKDNGVWVYGCLVVSDQKYYIYFNSADEFCQTGNWLDKVEVDPGTRGEYTGLCDKNGKRIFEGDILEFTYNDVEKSLNTVLYTVQWSDNYDNYAGWVIQENKKGINPDKMDYWNGNCFEVIGNIHDNSELLNENRVN